MILAASLAAVQAAPATSEHVARQTDGLTGADVNGGDAACPYEEPFRVRPDDQSSFWYNICTSYATAYVSLDTLFRSSKFETSLNKGGETLLLCILICARLKADW